MSITGKLNSIPVLSNAARKLNNFFKTSKRFLPRGHRWEMPALVTVRQSEYR